MALMLVGPYITIVPLNYKAIMAAFDIFPNECVIIFAFILAPSRQTQIPMATICAGERSQDSCIPIDGGKERKEIGLEEARARQSNGSLRNRLAGSTNEVETTWQISLRERMVTTHAEENDGISLVNFLIPARQALKNFVGANDERIDLELESRKDVSMISVATLIPHRNGVQNIMTSADKCFEVVFLYAVHYSFVVLTNRSVVVSLP